MFLEIRVECKVMNRCLFVCLFVFLFLFFPGNISETETETTVGRRGTHYITTKLSHTVIDEMGA